MKFFPKRLQLNGNTVRFHPQTQKLGLHTKYIAPCYKTAEEVSFEWSHHRITSTDSKLELHNKYIVPCESTAEEVSFEW